MSGAGWWRGVRVVGKGLCLVPGYWEGAGGFGLTPELLFLWGGQWVVESGGGCCIAAVEVHWSGPVQAVFLCRGIC